MSNETETANYRIEEKKYGMYSTTPYITKEGFYLWKNKEILCTPTLEEAKELIKLMRKTIKIVEKTRASNAKQGNAD